MGSILLESTDPCPIESLGSEIPELSPFLATKMDTQVQETMKTQTIQSWVTLQWSNLENIF